MKIGDYLRRFLDKDQFKSLNDQSSLLSEWESLVGKLAAHSKIFDVEKGTLTVDADHPGWMQLLQMREREILTKIKRKFPTLEIQRMRFRLVDNLDAPPKSFSVPELEYAPTLPIEPYDGTLDGDDPVLMSMMEMLEADAKADGKKT